VVAIDLQINGYSNRNLLAMPVGIRQKLNVDAVVQKVMHIFLFDIQKAIKYCFFYLISFNSVSSREFYNYSIPL
jgi:hypothetical protein